jgi:NADH-quinone oxidoreductase subunit L
MNSIYLILFLPLIGFFINLLIGKKLSKTISGALGTGVILINFLLVLGLFFQLNQGTERISTNIIEWFKTDTFTLNFSFSVDHLSILWMLFITGIGTLIHLYSIGYMKEDAGFSRFFSYLNLFIFFMQILVLGNSLLITFIGWEGVGLCSYLLIGFWNTNHEYNDAAKKAFVMNRIGDAGFLIACFMTLFAVGTLDYQEILANISKIDTQTAGFIALFLFIGAMGKSAQLPLYTWLPDAMAGPTPVSALIHAATMVTAGIYLLCRTHFIFNLSPEVLHFVAIIGASTALFAATIGLFQNDIKKVLAYSTVSQLGLMFLAIGLGAYSTAIFHVITHAFFKACLFLGAGSVIHALHHEQDIRNMGGLKKYLPITHLTFLIASLAIAGIPIFAGFFSKDEILAVAFSHNKVLWIVASITSILTAFYMFRLVFLTFYGKYKSNTHDGHEHQPHESPITITLPLMVLAFFSVVAGFIGLPTVISHYHWLNHFLEKTITIPTHHLDHSTEWMLMGLATTFAILSILVAYLFFVKKGIKATDKHQGITKIIYNKYYVDEMYDKAFVQPFMSISKLANEKIEAIGVRSINGTGSVVSLLSNGLAKIQNGNIGTYLLAFIVGIILILSLLIFNK